MDRQTPIFLNHVVKIDKEAEEDILLVLPLYAVKIIQIQSEVCAFFRYYVEHWQ